MTDQRMWDLVRQQRMELLTANLITEDEYAALAVDHPAVARLESYDELRTAHSQTIQELAQAKRDLAEGNRQNALILEARNQDQNVIQVAGKLADALGPFHWKLSSVDDSAPGFPLAISGARADWNKLRAALAQFAATKGSEK